MVVNVIFYAWSLFVKSKSKLFLLETISTIFFVLQYAFLYAWVGMVIAIVDLVRVAIFYILEAKNCPQKAKVITVIVSWLAAVVLSIITWSGWYSIIPLLGLTLMYIFTILPSLTGLKISIVINVLCTVLYLFFVGNIFNMVVEIILFVMCVIGTTIDIVREHRAKIKA